MSEERPEQAQDSPEEAADAGMPGGAPDETGQEMAPPARTGVEDVDGVLDSVEGLDQRPVEEHVAVFESAHDRLRRALDARTDG